MSVQQQGLLLLPLLRLAFVGQNKLRFSQTKIVLRSKNYFFRVRSFFNSFAFQSENSSELSRRQAHSVVNFLYGMMGVRVSSLSFNFFMFLWQNSGCLLYWLCVLAASLSIFSLILKALLSNQMMTWPFEWILPYLYLTMCQNCMLIELQAFLGFSWQMSRIDSCVLFSFRRQSTPRHCLQFLLCKPLPFSALVSQHLLLNKLSLFTLLGYSSSQSLEWLCAR